MEDRASSTLLKKGYDIAKILAAFTILTSTVGGPVLADRAPVPAPTYDNQIYWAAGSLGLDVAGALPEGAGLIAADPQVDVFWVHPTTTRLTQGLNHDPLDTTVRKWTDESTIQRQASAFSGCCRIFAPRYRAATFNAFTNSADREAAFALAFSDIERAFDWYLEHENHGRPFILSGHSQGAFHVATLLEKRLDGTPLQDRLVAAYVIGIGLAEGEFGPRFKHLQPCRKPYQTGCVLQWNSYLAGTDLKPAVAAFEKNFTDKYGDAPGKRPVCINPVTFDADRPASLSAEALGSVPGDPGFGKMEPLRKGAVAVQCEHGLAVSFLAPGLELKPLPGGSMHYHDVGLFWGDIRANAIARSNEWLSSHDARE